MNNIELQSKFGRLLVESFRRSVLIDYYMLLNHPQNLKRLIGSSADQLSDEMKIAIRKLIISGIDSAMSDFLYALDNYNEYMDELKIIVNGEDILDGNLQVMLQGGEADWIEQFGKIDDIDEYNYLSE